MRGRTQQPGAFLVAAIATNRQATFFVFGLPHCKTMTTSTTNMTNATNQVAAAASTRGAAAAEDIAIRPFRVNVPESKLEELHRRVAATQWPDKETVADHSQGVQLATMQRLAHYWA